MLLIFTSCSIFPVIPLAKLYNVDYVFENYVTIAILGLLFGWAIFSMAMMFSSFFSERSKTYLITGSVLIIMYAFNVSASFKETWKNLKYFSFFHYYDYNQALINNSIDNLSFWVFGGTILICTLIGAIWFNKRDVAV